MRPLTRRTVMAAVLAAAAAPALAGGDMLHVQEPWTRPALPNRPSAIYLSVHNAMTEDDRLVGARSPAFERIELHRTTMTDGVMQMGMVEGETVAADGTLVLEPAGLHFMAFGASERWKEGDTFPLTLVFETAGEVETTVTVMPMTHGIGHDGGHGHGTGG